jgi:hypothetical protein
MFYRLTGLWDNEPICLYFETYELVKDWLDGRDLTLVEIRQVKGV